MTDPRPNGGVVLDASAVLALLFAELGADVVRASVPTGIIGAVNLAEVLAKLSDDGVPTGEAAQAVAMLGLEVVPMTEAQARRSARFRASAVRPGYRRGTGPAWRSPLSAGCPP